MAQSVKSIIKKVIGFGVLGIIAVYLLYGAVDTFLHYYFKRSRSYYGGVTIKVETVAGRECYCFYTNEKTHTSTEVYHPEVIGQQARTGYYYQRHYVKLGANLLVRFRKENPPFPVMDMEGEWYEGAWNTPSAVPNLVGEVVFVNPDGSEEVI